MKGNLSRSGSLAYYFAAWACGCVSMAALVWLRTRVGGGGPMAEEGNEFLLTTFYALIFGAAPALAGAFLMRHIAVLLRLRSALSWILAGMAITPLLILPMAWIAAGLERRHIELEGVLGVIFLGVRAVMNAGWWLAIPAGGFTALILQRVHIAFVPEEERSAAES
jgi:hypothetical protein